LKPPRVLIIAGSDSGGGAGIQADIKTVTMLGGFAMTAITVITVQNTLGVTAVHPIPPAIVVGQIDAVVADLGVDVVKIGMIGSPECAEAIADRLARLEGIPIVFDPVMVATSGAVLADPGTVETFERLMALAALVTPNAPELTALTGAEIASVEELEAAALLLARKTGAPILAKGGHIAGPLVVDLLVFPEGNVTRWSDERLDSRNTHGTGCTLASAIATSLGSGEMLVDAVAEGRAFVRAAIEAAPGFGAGHGPMGHQAVQPQGRS
jgi:hydroxymethylpyrimidine/phosphomethylpyrimidine kinase